MAACSSCGTPVTDLQKFCRGCGATVRAAPVAASAPAERTCGRCGHYVATDARFCRACGTGFEPSQSQPHVAAPHLRKRRSTAVWLIPVIATLSIAMIAAAYFLWSRGFSNPIPDATIVQNAVAQQLPPYVRVNSLTLGQLQRDDSATPPLMNGQFTAAAVLTASLYKPSRADGDVTFLAEQAAAGTKMELAGSVLLRQNEGQWESRVVLATTRSWRPCREKRSPTCRRLSKGHRSSSRMRTRGCARSTAAQAAEAARAAAEDGALAAGRRRAGNSRQNGRPRPAGRRSWRRLRNGSGPSATRRCGPTSPNGSAPLALERERIVEEQRARAAQGDQRQLLRRRPRCTVPFHAEHRRRSG